MSGCNVRLPIPGHPEAHFRVRGDKSPTAEDVAALEALGKMLVERYRDVVPVVAVPLSRRLSRREQKREQVRLALLARRDRRRVPCEARLERADRDMYRAYARMAEGCRCCFECSPGACDEVFQGAGCARRCVCDERKREEELCAGIDDDDDEAWEAL